MNPHDVRRLVLARELLARPSEATPTPAEADKLPPPPRGPREGDETRMSATHDTED